MALQTLSLAYSNFSGSINKEVASAVDVGEDVQCEQKCSI
jgi:hypothetical protein